MSKKFEYSTYVDNDRFSPNVGELNRLGAEGWRVVDVQAGGVTALYLPEREVADVR